MTTILRDSINPNSIPPGTPVVGGYVDGLYGVAPYWTAGAFARWAVAGAQLRRIAAVTINTPSNTADVERFDLSPGQAAGWHHNMTALGETDLWVYVNRSNQMVTEDALWAAGIPLESCSMWIATLDGTQVVARYRYPIAAVQYVDTGPYDESIVYQAFGPGGIDLLPDERAALFFIKDWINVPVDANGNPQTTWGTYLNSLGTQIAEIHTEVTKIANTPPGTTDLTPVLNAIATVQTTLDNLTLKKA